MLLRVLFLRATNYVDRPNTSVWIYLTKWNREMHMHAHRFQSPTYMHKRPVYTYIAGPEEGLHRSGQT